MKKQIDKILEEIVEGVDFYQSGRWANKEKLIKVQRSISSNVFYLTQHNIEAYNKWNAIVYNRNGGSVNAAQVKADNEVPELRMTRKILEATKNVQIAISNELSILKNDD